jgi:dihydrofolate synthase/folylpolyglutamate synthase
MLSAVFRRSGLRTGLFTSPHLCRVEERVQVDGRPIGPDELTALMQALEAPVTALDTQGTPPTFFEIVTALAVLHFARHEVNVAVLEVGLGGRFDSTNVCTPLVAMITSISLDHTQQLGTTLAAIAREKAGIIKPGRPVISGVTGSEAREVVAEVAMSNGSPLAELGRDFDYQYSPGWLTADSTQWPQVRVEVRKRKSPGADRPFANSASNTFDFTLPLLGKHQASNAALVVACVDELRRQGWAIPDEAIRRGLSEVYWPARMEVVSRQPMIIIDCAHNVASMQALVEALSTTFPPARRGLVLACSRDKDLSGIVSVLAPHFAFAFMTGYRSSSRAANPVELAALWRAAGGNCNVYSHPAQAWQAARSWVQPADLLCITGSVFLAGELWPVLHTSQSAPFPS